MINIIILISLLLFVFLVLYLRKEKFSLVDDIVNTGTSTNPYLDTIKHSIENNEFELNVDPLDLHSLSITKLLDAYIEKKQVKSNNPTDLPIMGNSTMRSYNNQMKILNNSKKIKQDFILNALKGKINFLLESLKDLEIK
jgi:hypothetical protein